MLRVEAADYVQKSLWSPERPKAVDRQVRGSAVKTLPDVSLATSQRPTATLHVEVVGELRVHVVDAFARQAAVLHPEKLESFGTTQKVRESLHEFSDTVGVPQFTFKLLGIPYNTSRAAPVATEGIVPSLQARCKRIQMFGTSRGLRCALFRKLVVSLFRWGAPWLRFSKKLLATWKGAIERAAWGGSIPRGRSAALAWLGVVGLDLLPEYVCAETAIVREHRRLHVQRHREEATYTAAAFRAAGWQRGAGDIWTTRHGSFRAGTVSAAGLRRQHRFAWGCLGSLFWRRNFQWTGAGPGADCC